MKTYITGLVLAAILVVSTGWTGEPSATVKKGATVKEVTQTTIKLGSLKCNSQYRVTVAKRKADGRWSRKQTIRRTTKPCRPPRAPQSATVTDVTQTTIKLGSLKCNSQYRFTVAKRKADGRGSRKQTIRRTTKRCRSDTNCMPDPSACGYPDAGNTGVQPGVALTSVSGGVTLSTPGQVYKNKELTGSIEVTAPNVTIRNVRLINTDPYYAIAVRNGSSWNNDQANLLLDHVEINLDGHMGDPTGGDLKGIAFNGYTARHVLFTNGTDCAHFGDNVVIEDSLCVAGPDANTDGVPDSSSHCDGPQHFDGFQSDGGQNIVLRHNTILNPCKQTSAILLSSNSDHISTVRVENNLMTGGGWTLYCAGPDGTSVDHIVVTGNRFARTYWPRSGYFGPAAYCEFSSVSFSGNVWDDTGKPVR